MPQSSDNELVINLLSSWKGESERTIIAVIGPNGSGKTRFLQHTVNRLRRAHGVPVLFVGANRRFGSAQSAAAPVEEVSVIKEALGNWHTIGSGAQVEPWEGRSLEQIISGVLGQMTQNYNNARKRTSEDLAKWDAGGRIGPPPDAHKPNFGSLTRVVQETLGFPAEISFRGEHKEQLYLSIYRDNHKIPPSSLSEGEQQILLLCALLLRKPDERVVVIVDEPELHLNDLRADKIWSSIENNFANASFMYATHSPFFATRTSTNKLVAMDDGRPDIIPSGENLPASVVRAVAGSRTHIMRADLPIIFCEDRLQEAMLKVMFPDVTVSVTNGITEVMRAVKFEKHWKKHRIGDSRYCGVRDRDGTVEANMGRIRPPVFCLPFFDVEGILLEKSLVDLILPYGQSLDQNEYGQMIVVAAEAAKDETVNGICNELIKAAARLATARNTGDPYDYRIDMPIDGINQELGNELQSIKIAVELQNLGYIIRRMDGKKLFRLFFSELHAKKHLGFEIEPIEVFRRMKVHPEFETRLLGIHDLDEFRQRVADYLSI